MTKPRITLFRNKFQGKNTPAIKGYININGTDYAVDLWEVHEIGNPTVYSGTVDLPDELLRADEFKYGKDRVVEHEFTYGKKHAAQSSPPMRVSGAEGGKRPLDSYKPTDDNYIKPNPSYRANKLLDEAVLAGELLKTEDGKYTYPDGIQYIDF
jgi:hypothetical protein